MSFVNSILFTSSEMSNFLPFLGVIVCVGAMLTFLIKAAIILRVQGDGGDAIRATAVSNTHASSRMQVPRLKMTRVHIPFTFRLLESVNTSYEEVCLAVSSQVKYTLQAFWAVSIRELHMSLWRPWSELREAAYMRDRGIVDVQHYQHLAVDIRNKSPHSEEIITLKSPNSPLALGAPPRLSYPLVIFLIRNFEQDEILHPDETVILVNVVHLRDPVCPLPTSVLAQYLKQSSGQLSCLKQLYLATGDPLSGDETTTPIQTGSLSLAEPVACAGNGGPILCSDGPQMEQLCVVCHYFPLSRALLPCRHTCICAVCFSKLERCPMCRAPITSYFCIRSEEYLPPNHTESRPAKTKGNVHWLDALNDRLTDFLGFR
ncbi:cell growth regulator with RING finger domain protein 1-like [Lutzomyia longipalpis]|nr:cell growth regulator with RING finger domain protein 1-like [Lutzomyia longipalpis]